MAFRRMVRPGFVQLRVLDLDKTLNFYKNILGLDEVGSTRDGRIMLKAYDEFDHHSVVLRRSKHAGLDYVGFKVMDEEQLEEIKVNTEKFGYKVTEIPANTEQPGIGKQYKFTLCTGHEIHVYCDVDLAKDHPQLKNPDIWTKPPRGMKVTMLNHIMLYGPGIEEAERFMVEVFGMFVPEICNNPNGKRLATWLTGNSKSHDVTFVEYTRPNTLHHVGFHLQTSEDLLHAADLIAVNNLKLDVGPTRHAITRELTIYFWDPSGNRLETHSGGYIAYPDHPQRVWDADRLGRGLFYFSGEIVPSFLENVA